MIYIAGLSFKTQSLCKEWIKQQLIRIGICDTIKSDEDLKLLKEIIKNHPNKEKTKDVIDFRIRTEFRGYALDIITPHGVDSISWVSCATGKGKTDNMMLMQVLRTTIRNQIIEFKNKQTLICAFCSSTKDTEIDHIKTFKDIVSEFNKGRTPPTVFKKYDLGKYTFTDEDAEYHSEWVQYHKAHATLRVLCRECNLKRNREA